ncbi:MAG: hypothetical protein IPG75_10030 [Gemmatimonadetes bacterium]|nr:hypothetical protein [Gemmatimonadota bacterium]
MVQPSPFQLSVLRVDTIIPPGGVDTILVSIVEGVPIAFQPYPDEVRCAIRLGARHGLLSIQEVSLAPDRYHIVLKVPLTADSVLVVESVASTWFALLAALPPLSTIRLE